MARWFCVVLLSLSAVGCAARRPVLYPNAHYDRVGQIRADQDIDECVRLAQGRGSREAGRAVARDTALASGTGAAAGAAGGAVFGDAGRGAAAGAAGGAAAGLLHGLFRAGEPSDIHKRYVDACLEERGYRVIGWD